MDTLSAELALIINVDTFSSAINITTTGVAIAVCLLGRLDIFGRDQQIYDIESCKMEATYYL